MMEKPKRPMSAYLLWLNSARAQIKADHPGLKVTEVAKKAGELWRAMEDKSTWEQRAAAAKEQYTLDLEAFNATGADGAAPPAKRAQKRQGKARQPKLKKGRATVKKEDSDEEGDDDEGEDNEAEESE